LTKLQLDALKEISSIGAGNAATALSQFIDKEVEMDPPEVIIAAAQRVPQIIKEEIPKLMMVALEISGDVFGHLLVIFNQDNAANMVDFLMGRQLGSTAIDLSEIDISALKEVASVMSGSFLRVLGDTINKTLQMSPPDFSQGSAAKVSEFILKHSIKENETTICLKSNLWVEDKIIKVFLYLVFVPSASSLRELLRLLGMEEAGTLV
jgi:chemotaxis protein CheC